MEERLPEAVQHPVPHRTARDNCPQKRLDAAKGALPIPTGSDTFTSTRGPYHEVRVLHCGRGSHHVPQIHRPTAVALIDHLKGREKALEPFGLTGRRAEWIALASLHGGVFTRSQLSAWFGIDRFKTLRFVQALTRRRLAAEEMVGDLKICRICARGIYRALGAEGIRLRRITSTEVIMRRVLSFDYVIEHPDLPWLPTEQEKVAAFEALDMGRSLMPIRVYRGAAGGARRYFPRGMPVALDSRRAVFVHADPGYDTSTALRSWRDRHQKLWEALRQLGLAVEVVGVACARRPLDRARTILGNWTKTETAPRPIHPPGTAAAARREVTRIENAIVGMDDAGVEEMGGFQACLHRMVELEDMLRSMRPAGTIDGHSVWRSSRFRGRGI